MSAKNKVAQIDFSRIDIEIQELEARLQELEAQLNATEEELAEKKRIRDTVRFALQQYGVESKMEPKLTVSNGRHDISVFIVEYLDKHGEVRLSDLIDTYAKFTGKDPTLARSNVSNALSRLKTAGKVENLKFEDGEKAWRLKN